MDELKFTMLLLRYYFLTNNNGDNLWKGRAMYIANILYDEKNKIKEQNLNVTNLDDLIQFNKIFQNKKIERILMDLPGMRKEMLEGKEKPPITAYENFGFVMLHHYEFLEIFNSLSKNIIYRKSELKDLELRKKFENNAIEKIRISNNTVLINENIYNLINKKLLIKTPNNKIQIENLEIDLNTIDEEKRYQIIKLLSFKNSDVILEFIIKNKNEFNNFKNGKLSYIDYKRLIMMNSFI